MAAFDFALDGVLRQRKHVEQQAQLASAKAEAAVAELQDRLRQIGEEIKTSADHLRDNHLVGRLDVSYLIGQRRFGDAKQRQGEALVAELTAAAVVSQSARAVLLEAAKRRKAVEVLRDKALARWRAAEAAREQADLDEVGTQIGYESSRDGP